MSADVHIAGHEEALAQAEHLLRHLSDGFARAGYREASPSYIRLAQLLAGLHAAEAAPDAQRWAALCSMAASSAEILDGMAAALRAVAAACSEAMRPAMLPEAATGAGVPGEPEISSIAMTEPVPTEQTPAPARGSRSRKASPPAKKPRSRPTPTKPARRKKPQG